MIAIICFLPPLGAITDEAESNTISRNIDQSIYEKVVRGYTCQCQRLPQEVPGQASKKELSIATLHFSLEAWHRHLGDREVKFLQDVASEEGLKN